MNIPVLLATSSQETAVWLCFGFYLMNVLVPIAPAVVIYRLFPEGNANARRRKSKRAEGETNTSDSGNSITGSIGGWKIKAVGAWGAYVTTFVLGYWAINATAVPLIKAVGGASVWVIDTDFQLLDETGKQVPATTVDKLHVDPPMVTPWGKHAKIRVFSDTLAPPKSVNMELEGYEKTTVDIDGKIAFDGQIKLPPVTLKLLPPLAGGTPPPPLTQGQGPAPLTAQK
jgi:hypothetical protein